MEIIKTDRLILRKPQISDKEQLLSLLNNEEVSKYVSCFYLTTLEEINEFLKFDFNFIEEFCFIIEEISSKAVVGLIYSRLFIDYIAHTLYITKAEERGKGYMPEAVKAFALYMYENKIASSLMFTIKKDNKSSKRVMNKLKIKPEFHTNDCRYYTLSLNKRPSF